MYGQSGRIFQEVFHRVLDAAGFPKVERKGKTRRYIVFHGTRHTFASHWVMEGGDIFKLQKLLGHKSIQMTQRYAHLAPEAFSADYGRFRAPKLAASAAVIELPR
jgi:site-specific recombinase XerD